ncbi:molecular chaperone TorD [Shewanella schlegeliana]|uniref:Chaperone protein TorD n=1 Tax=Shewanella schlegeliana TaxID=190308 RepID=A0ABS1T2E9_9GAMM|nr:molecular chaperone TorD [Shewanella schlegeliana]MBL4914405.1 molecular chaperone TorD [Shewanella schlegeliana]MCL1109371.1 molecular chaperone TorD [Shewanella schlegeliana]GIU31792.1 chaperone protein TorD [Shewanella schlegeliana]
MSTDAVNTEPVEVNPVNQVRSTIYQLLSSLFAKEIDHKTLHDLTSEQAQNFWAQLGSESAFKADVNILVAELATLNTDKALLELAADYCGLFLVGTKFSASPYAGLYLDNKPTENGDEPLLFGEQHQQMTQFLKQSQLQVQSEFPEPADHLAVILAYVAHLCIHSDEAVQLSFIEANLTNWLSRFVDKVTEVDNGNFYQALARLTLSWVKSDAEWLASELN